MFFDAQVQVAQVEVEVVDDHVQLTQVLALALPGPQGIMAIPVGVLRVPLSGQAAIEHGQQMIDAGNKLNEQPPEKKPDIVIAQSLKGVDAAAKQVERFAKKT